MILTMLRMKSSAALMPELIRGLRALMRPARAEKGFIACRLYLEADDPNTLCYEERWEGREDLADQVRSSRYTHLLALMESAVEKPTLEFHFVTRSRGLDYVAAVRGAEELDFPLQS